MTTDLHALDFVDPHKIVWRTDADRIRELGRCQVCGAPRERIEFTYATPALEEREGVAIVCAAEAAHEMRARRKDDATPLPAVRASGSIAPVTYRQHWKTRPNGEVLSTWCEREGRP